MLRCSIFLLAIGNVISWPEPQPFTMNNRPLQLQTPNEQASSLPVIGLPGIQYLKNNTVQSSNTDERLGLPDTGGLTEQKQTPPPEPVESEIKQEQQTNANKTPNILTVISNPVENKPNKDLPQVAERPNVTLAINIPGNGPLKPETERPSGQTIPMMINHPHVLSQYPMMQNPYHSGNSEINGIKFPSIFGMHEPYRPPITFRPLMQGLYAHSVPSYNTMHGVIHPVPNTELQNMPLPYNNNKQEGTLSFTPLERPQIHGVMGTENVGRQPQVFPLRPIIQNSVSSANLGIERPHKDLLGNFPGISRPFPPKLTPETNMDGNLYGNRQKQMLFSFAKTFLGKLFSGRFRLSINAIRVEAAPVHSQSGTMSTPLQFSNIGYMPQHVDYNPLPEPPMNPIQLQSTVENPVPNFSLTGINYDNSKPDMYIQKDNQWSSLQFQRPTPVPFDSLYKQYQSMTQKPKENQNSKDASYIDLYRLYEIMKAMKTVNKNTSKNTSNIPLVPPIGNNTHFPVNNITTTEVPHRNNQSNASKRGPIKRQMQPQFSVTGKPSFDPSSMSAGQFNPNSNSYGSGSFDPNSMKAGGFDPNTMSAGSFNPNSMSAGSFSPNSMSAGSYDPNKQPIGNFDPSSFGKK